MFYYLSFLRPPPIQIQALQSLSLTPQIANDLRTELCPDELDIFYHWLPSQTDASGSSVSQDNKVQQTLNTPVLSKLTTWREASAYKEVRVSPPRGARDGQSWRLMLCTRPKTGNIAQATIDFSQNLFGEHPFSVLSMPIAVGSKSRQLNVGNSPLKGKYVSTNTKQEQIERLFSFPVEFTPATLRIRERLSFDLDKKLWDSGIGLSYWLTTLFAKRSQAEELARRLFTGSHRTIIELGAGTGLVSVVLAALLSCSQPPSSAQVNIIATDLPSAMELIKHNITANQALYPSVVPRAVVLDWNEDKLPTEVEAGVDVVIMADVTYNTASFPSLIGTLCRLCHAGSEPPLLLLGYKERDPAERTLWNMALEMGIEFIQLEQVKGAGGAPIEIHLGHVQLPCGDS